MKRGLVELVVVREDDDRGLVVGLDLRKRLLRPLDDELVHADGIPFRVANFARASATIACQPRSFAPRHIASAVSTAP